MAAGSGLGTVAQPRMETGEARLLNGRGRGNAGWGSWGRHVSARGQQPMSESRDLPRRLGRPMADGLVPLK